MKFFFKHILIIYNSLFYLSEKSIEILYIIIKKDEKILNWLIDSLKEVLLLNATSYLSAFKMINKLSNLHGQNDNAETTNSQNSTLSQLILDIFEKIIDKITTTNSGHFSDQFISTLLNTFSNTVEHLSKK